MPDILIVDDTPANRRLLELLLTRSGYSSGTAIDGAVCLEVLAKTTFRLVIMDVRMPIMDGHEATQRIRSDPALCHVPIICLTANDTPEERKKCLASGAQAFLGRPFQKDELLRLIQEFILPEEKSLAGQLTSPA